MRTSLAVVVGLLLAVSLVAAAGATVAAEESSGGCEYPIELTDGGSGETVTVEEAPDRIVVLQASDANTVFELGAGDRVVGMPHTDATDDLDRDHTEDIREDAMATDVEKVVDLEPDVVVASNVTDPETVDQLRDEADLDVYYFSEATSIDDVTSNVEVTGQLVGACDVSEMTTEWMTDRLQLVESAATDVEEPTTHYEMGQGWTAGPGTFQHELLTTAGLDTTAEAAEIEGWGEIDAEEIVAHDPEWVVYDDSWPEAELPDGVEGTTAQEEDNFYSVDANDFNQPAPAIVYAAEELLEGIHPDAHQTVANDIDDRDESYEEAKTAYPYEVCEYPIELTDGGSGETVTLEETPEEIVVLQPSDANTVFELGAGDRVVGMPHTDATADLDRNHTDDIREDAMTTDVETVVDHDPDIVIASNASDPETVDQLRDEADLDVYYFSAATSIDDVTSNVEVTGQLVGECVTAAETVHSMTDRLDAVESDASDLDQELVYYAMGDGWTAGPGTFQHELLEAAGFENLAEEVGIESWGMLDDEEILAHDPEWIVYGDSFLEPPISDSTEMTTAYQDDNVVAVDANAFSQPAPAIVDAAEDLLEARLDAADDGSSDRSSSGSGSSGGFQAPDETDEDDENETAENESVEEEDLDIDSDETEQTAEAGDDDVDESDDADDEPDPIPGFGIAAAVVALLVAAGLARVAS